MAITMFSRVFSFLFLFLTASFLGAQNSIQLQWNASLNQLDSTHYEVLVEAGIPEYAYMYSAESGLTDVDTPSFVFNEGALQPVQISREGALQPVYDSVFSKSIQALRGTVLWRFVFEQRERIKKIKTKVVYNVAAGSLFLPDDVVLTAFGAGAQDGNKMSSLKIPTIDIAHPRVVFDAGATAQAASDSGGWALFFLGFLGGLLALLTPCVFPMIPLTISFFSKSAASRKASVQMSLLYGMSIVFIYLLAAAPFHLLDKLNPNILNSVATSPLLNLIFFLLFVFFAFSFFGFYDITLPSGLGNMADSRSRGKKHIGIFFMALTLCIVSFSCTGPILGSLLAGSLSNAEGGAMALTWGLLGFGVALALPFTLIAFFPHSMNALPKSGSWMNTFKVSLGFLELAFAFKFLSNTDLIWHWGLLKREVFVLFWVLIGVLYLLYLVGVVPIYGRASKISWGRKITALAVLAFTVYMALALPKRPLTRLALLSGFAPPEFYSIYTKESDCALGLRCVTDYEEALVLSKQFDKPILLDFTGWACVNCRKMEEHVWAQPEVYELMKNEFILLSLYVDDRRKLPVEEQIERYVTADGLETEVVTVGDKWSLFETENFHNNAQPLYAVLSSEGQLLISPVGYLPEAATYKKWLETALDAYKNK